MAERSKIQDDDCLPIFGNQNAATHVDGEALGVLLIRLTDSESRCERAQVCVPPASQRSTLQFELGSLLGAVGLFGVSLAFGSTFLQFVVWLRSYDDYAGLFVLPFGSIGFCCCLCAAIGCLFKKLWWGALTGAGIGAVLGCFSCCAIPIWLTFQQLGM